MTDHTPWHWPAWEDLPGSGSHILLDRDTYDRAKACVDACAGIPTERLKPGSVAKAVDALDEIGHGAPWGGPAEDHVKFMRGTAVAALAPFQED